MVRTKITSDLSPWFNNVKVGDVHTIPVSNGEGRFLTDDIWNVREKRANYNSMWILIIIQLMISGLILMVLLELLRHKSDGRILGKMGHSERVGTNVAKNIPGQKDQKLFEAGVNYFK